ncbi:MAG: DUF805 domain-containing protein [Tannerella sp.]|jgi:uncharacterized membrane protein YhaH (DUF805 family)|nr:DUF805 domain-containing protein [Tannerella sp.]
MKWYLKVLEQYADFSGRARRKEYWMFYLFNTIIIILLAILKKLTHSEGYYGLGFLHFIYLLAVFVPSLAVGVRRLHDIDRSGVNILLSLIPLIGNIILLVWALEDGVPEENEWGPDPKENE